MKRIGIYGGMFDPVHNGHIYTAEKARQHTGVDLMLWAVAPQPLLKPNTPMFSLEARKDFVIASLPSNNHDLYWHDNVFISDTVSDILSRGMSPVLVLGTDLVHQIKEWNNYEKVLRGLEICWVNRKGYPHKIGKFETPIRMSSTDIRNRIDNKDVLEGLVPKNVIKLINWTRE